MTCLYDGFDIESFEAGKGLWHARIRRADLQPVMIDGIAFSALEVGLAWNAPEEAIADAKSHIDRCGLRGRGRPMSRIEVVPAASSGHVLPACPECRGGLAVLKIIPGRLGRGGCEYWTMRCTRCGGIHLDIVQLAGPPVA